SSTAPAPSCSLRQQVDLVRQVLDVELKRETRPARVRGPRPPAHYRPAPRGTGPSWLSFIGHTRDSLWSVDLFRCESIMLRSYWVLVVMDQLTRRLVGFGVQCGTVTGADVCRMVNAAIRGQGVPRHLSTDHDPLFE